MTCFVTFAALHLRNVGPSASNTPQRTSKVIGAHLLRLDLIVGRLWQP
jgi:hypothetical protein